MVLWPPTACEKLGRVVATHEACKKPIEISNPLTWSRPGRAPDRAAAFSSSGTCFAPDSSLQNLVGCRLMPTGRAGKALGRLFLLYSMYASQVGTFCTLNLLRWDLCCRVFFQTRCGGSTVELLQPPWSCVPFGDLRAQSIELCPSTLRLRS